MVLVDMFAQLRDREIVPVREVPCRIDAKKHVHLSIFIAEKIKLVPKTGLDMRILYIGDVCREMRKQNNSI